jgi:hypothetical protein
MLSRPLGLVPREKRVLRRSFSFLLSFAALAGLTVLLQIKSGAYSSEIAAFSDEPSHYINGLMIRDYFFAGFPVGPMKYAVDYYLQYPKVSIGHWPPFYYAVEALWMAVFSAGRVSVFVFCAMITTALAMLIGSQTRRAHGKLAGFFVAMIFIALPAVQYNTARLGLDLPVALLDLAAALVYAHYLDTGSCRHSALFAVVASMAIMVKGNAMELALLPAFVVLAGRRFALLRQPSFWLPLPMVAILCGPWYALTYRITADGFAHPWGLDYLWLAIPANSGLLVAIAGGILPFLFAAIGVAAKIEWQGGPRIGDNLDLVLLSLIMAVFAFQMIVPADIEERYLLPALPAVLLFAVDGVVLAARWAVRMWRDNFPGLRHSRAEPAAALIVAAILVATCGPMIAGIPAKPRTGMIEVARQILMSGPNANPLVLVAANPSDEGGLVAEMAMNDAARHFYVLRGSRILSKSDFMGRNYQPLFDSPADAVAYLDELGVTKLVLDSSPKSLEMEHDRQLQAAIAQDPGRWHLLGEYERSDGGETRFYELTGNEGRAIDWQKIAAATAPTKLVGQ